MFHSYPKQGDSRLDSSDSTDINFHAGFFSTLITATRIVQNTTSFGLATKMVHCYKRERVPKFILREPFSRTRNSGSRSRLFCVGVCEFANTFEPFSSKTLPSAKRKFWSATCAHSSKWTREGGTGRARPDRDGWTVELVPRVKFRV